MCNMLYIRWKGIKFFFICFLKVTTILYSLDYSILSISDLLCYKQITFVIAALKHTDLVSTALKLVPI